MAFLTGKGLVALTTILLARILSPHEFGIVAMATVFIMFADTIGDSGVAQTLIYLDRTRNAIRAATALALASGGALMVGAMALAPFIADAYGEPRVESLTRLLAVALLINAAAAVPEALLRAQLQFARWSLATAIKAATTGAVSITLALFDLGALSLVVGTLAGSVVYLIVLLLMLTSRPDLRFWLSEWTDIRAVLRFGVPVAAAMLLSRLIFDLDYVVVGAIGARELGLYTLSFKLPELAIVQVFFVISSVTYPLYTRANKDPERLRRGYLLSMKVQSLYGLSAGVGLAATAPLVVPVVLGDRWAEAVPTLVVLSLYAAVRSLSAGANDVYKAIGRPAISVWISLVRLILLVPAMIYAAQWGILGVAVAQAVMAAIFVFLMQGVALRVLDLGWSDLLRALLPGTVTAAAVGVTAWLSTAFIPGPAGSALLATVVLAVLVGGGVALLTAKDAAAAVAPRLFRRHAARPSRTSR